MRGFDIDPDKEKKRSFSGSPSSSDSSGSAEFIRDFRNSRSLGHGVRLHQVVLDLDDTPYVVVRLGIGIGESSFIQYYLRCIRRARDGSFHQMIITNDTPGWRIGGSFSGPKEFLDPDADPGSLHLILKQATAPRAITPRLLKSRQRNLLHKAKPRKERFIARTQAKGNYESGSFDFGCTTPRLPGRMRPGRAGQPYYSTNKDEYDQADVGTRYTHIVSAIQKAVTAHVVPERQIAADILAYIELGTPLPETYTAELRRAAAHLIHLTQVVEAHVSRVPGADKLARELLRKISQGACTFEKAFAGSHPLFFMGADGGQAIARKIMDLPAKKGDKETVDGFDLKAISQVDHDMSESSDG